VNQSLPYIFEKGAPGWRGLEVETGEEFEIRAFHGADSSEIFVYRIANRELVGYSCASSDREFYNDLREFCADFDVTPGGPANIPVLE